MSIKNDKLMTRSYSKGHFGFVLDRAGASTAWVKSVSGGNLQADVSSEQLNSDIGTVRSVENLRIEPITVQQAIGASLPIYEWLHQSLGRDHVRCNGCVFHADFRQEVRYELEFQDALLTEVTFPALDAASDEPGYITFKLQPEVCKMTKGDGKKLKSHGFKEGTTPKLWTLSNFGISLFRNGFKIDTDGVRKIESFTIKQGTKVVQPGSMLHRFSQYEPTGIEYPGLTLSVSMAYVNDFYSWYVDFLQGGNSAATDEMTGYIEFLHPHKRTPLLTINLNHVGVTNVEVGENTADESIHMAKVELYVESMEIELDKDGR